MRTASVVSKKTNQTRPFTASSTHFKKRTSSKHFENTFQKLSGLK